MSRTVGSATEAVSASRSAVIIRHMRAILAPVLLVLVLAAGCSDTPTAAEPEPSKPPANGGQVANAEALAARLAAAGEPCPGLRPFLGQDTLAMGGLCATEDGQRVSINIYSPTEVQRIVAETAALPPHNRGESMASGVNWTVTGPDAYVTRVAEAMGGKLTTIP